MKISYGIDVQESDDPHILLTEESVNGLTEASIPGAFWVDFFPILSYVPSWFPGGGFQKKAAHWRQVNASMKQLPFDYVKDQLVRVVPPCSIISISLFLQTNGTASPSVVATLIERFSHEDDPQRVVEEKHAKDVAATTYIGLWWQKYIPNGRHTDSFITSLSLAGGVDSVSERRSLIPWMVVNCNYIIRPTRLCKRYSW